MITKTYQKTLAMVIPLVLILTFVAYENNFFDDDAFDELVAPTSSKKLNILNPVLLNKVSHEHVGYACYKLRLAGEPASVLYSGFDQCVHNVFTNRGMNATRDFLFHGATGTYNVISVGIVNASQTVVDECLSNQTGAGAYCRDWTANGLTQAVGTVKDIVSGGGVDFGNVSITKTFTCTDCTDTVINGTGLYNTTTTGISSVNGQMMFAEANFTSATLQTNDQINVTWFIWTQ